MDTCESRTESGGGSVKGHYYGIYESVKFGHMRPQYREYVSALEAMALPVGELLEDHCAYIGHLSLQRTLTLYELYRKVSTMAGHIAEIGVYKGASLLLFAKLLKLYEPNSLWMVHGFDWFRGSEPGPQEESLVRAGSYTGSKNTLESLIKMQGLEGVARVHDLDVRCDLAKFLDSTPHLRFRLIFMDCGLYDVMDKAIPLMWERLLPGGLMIFDQFSHELAPGEVEMAVHHLDGVVYETIPNSWMPNAFARKVG